MIAFFRRYKITLVYSAIFLASYLIFLVSSIPASMVVPYITQSSAFKLAGVQGSAWSGSARQLSLGKLQWQNVNWNVHPWGLLLGQLNFDARLGDATNNFRGELTLNSSGKLKIENAELSMPLDTLQAFSYGMPIAYQGKINAYLPLVIFERNKLFVVEGRVTLSGIELTAPQPLALGSIKVEFKTNKDGESVGQVSSVDGPVIVEGQVQLSRSAQVVVNLQLAARESGSDIDKALMLLGKRDASGRVAFQYRYQIR